MTPSLQQAIKLLQMNRLELQGVVTQEMVENPVLEESQDSEVEDPAKGPESEEGAEAGADDTAMDNIDFEAYFGDYMEGSTYSSTWEERQGAPLENTLSREPDLYDHLLWQLHMADVSARQREISELIIGNLDPDGFLVATCAEIQALSPLPPDGSEEAEAPYPEAEVFEALRLVRSFDPPGIACKDLRESLLVQLQLSHGVVPEDGFHTDSAEDPEREVQGAEELSEEGDGTEAKANAEAEEESPELTAYLLAERILSEYWPLFLKRQFAAIARELGVKLESLEPAVDLVRGLELRPGRRFNTERPQYIEPDVAVIKISGEYVIQLNDDGMPRLRISQAYRQMLGKMRGDVNNKEAQTYIKDKMRSALWLIKSLDQRQRTIYKVADSIVKQQQEFLEKGIDHLRPMVLRDVADDISMHESTVSRVVSNKYIHTPRGLLPMKFFFHSGIDRDYGENISSLSVKRKIQQLIQEEPSNKPLSDSELMRILKRGGIQIARRTVAKYRDELRIPSSTDRKQIF